MLINQKSLERDHMHIQRPSISIVQIISFKKNDLIKSNAEFVHFQNLFLRETQ